MHRLDGMMHRPRTIFPAFALVAALTLGVALIGAERGAPAQPVAAFARGGRHIPAPRAELIIPVSGLSAAQLEDTWGQTRSEGRTHEGIDILAPRGTAVVAVADGRIVKFFDSVRGGITIFQFDSSESFVYYYAHLDSRAAGLAEGDIVRQGDVIGAVGMTGNAPIPHLHFEIQRLTPARHWWEADSINPYPYLVSGRAP